MGHIMFMVIEFYTFYSNGFVAQMSAHDLAPTNNLFNGFLKTHSVANLLHVKPYHYGPSYLNGLILGDLMKTTSDVRQIYDNIYVKTCVKPLALFWVLITTATFVKTTLFGHFAPASGPVCLVWPNSQSFA
ncbi:unnamed protein product [Oppiella nova]|uniref:Uncharacterized protein n=1 Tax=Oppiella nova TaxID=334625 RepID=A0A7R9MJE8_9ACAR|nr:unnamed protein product [Oppiella nova]CAG2177330.1 unnamed protein product [Oppiella nova]